LISLQLPRHAPRWLPSNARSVLGRERFDPRAEQPIFQSELNTFMTLRPFKIDDDDDDDEDDDEHLRLTSAAASNSTLKQNTLDTTICRYKST
jgi:hypothetical protein